MKTGFFTVPNRGQCTPKQAAVVSLVVVLAGPLVAFAAHAWYYVSLKDAFACYGLCAWVTVATFWCFLVPRTKTIAIQLWNTGVLIFSGVLIVCIFTQEEGEEFPRWGIGLMIKQGILWAVVMSYFACSNFLKWRKGEL